MGSHNFTWFWKESLVSLGCSVSVSYQLVGILHVDLWIGPVLLCQPEAIRKQSVNFILNVWIICLIISVYNCLIRVKICPEYNLCILSYQLPLSNIYIKINKYTFIMERELTEQTWFGAPLIPAHPVSPDICWELTLASGHRPSPNTGRPSFLGRQRLSDGGVACLRSLEFEFSQKISSS
jgi:hypothetical protein